MLGRSELLVAQIEHALSQLFPGAQSQMLLHSAGIWRRWASPDEVDDVARLVVPAEMQHWTTPRAFAPGRLYVPLTPGAVGALVEHVSGALEPSDELEVLRQYATLAMQTCERQRLARQGLEEVQAVQRVAERILKSHDLNEILLHITMEAKRLLSSDICGVLLREGDEIVMRRCVGNMSPETAVLRMGPGQGLAGLVLARRAPSSVDDYVSSGTISRDFFHLAEAEAVRSALAAPLLGREQTIGVLEVWRRRASTFTDADNSRLVALANLASIAIENAELYASQKQSVEQLAQANLALNQRYDTVEGLSKLTQDLMQLLLDGGGLNAIVAGASSYLGAAVVLVDLDGTLLAHAGQGRPEGEMLDELQAWLARNTRTREPQPLALQSMNWRAHPMSVGNETVAWVLGEVGPLQNDLTALALAQVAIVGALHRLEQRAASRARSETIDAIVWDLLQAEEPTRTAAMDRAADARLDLSGPLRLFIAELGPTTSGSAEPLQSAMRRQVLDVIGEVRPQGVRAVALRGLSLAILCTDGALDDIERLAVQLARRLQDRLTGRMVLIGGSSACPSAHKLHVAFRESQIALDVARQLQRSGAVVYDRAGVLGLLLGLRHEAGMQRFLALNLGRLLHEDEKSREQLLQTLRIFFDVNCSHEAAAQRLGVHRKTIANRIAKVSELTGLDFSTHDDRLVADISLYVHRLLSGGSTDERSP
ncbi:helix-turn-helix domain-containing protein [Variovorax sp. Sphag1AA]|uniref:helix-turn-helix domain-containing protein n=1 Tax=Variovorax sp. Sphag1AA TaxID=2587027 RepID=UPI0017B33E01|nr:helix-turn-helix domain-containing protein [Variovorax sp. Sphag1AA]MBB3180979.1 sugar diacid utilization regulator/putative methionine-R-sulfoxide reductase with GAF domain [Variovorax sp. Sphag1AA]